MYLNPTNEACNEVDHAILKLQEDALTGLLSNPKRLQSKYFYDEAGDLLFQKIMASPDYYLTDCEKDIFKNKTAALAKAISPISGDFDLIELGAGDGTKSQYLLSHLVQQNAAFRYVPIDISGHILQQLENRLKAEVPSLATAPLHGEYFEMLEMAYKLSDRPKVILFLGANIGNMTQEEAGSFSRELRGLVNPGDLLLIGLDLKKHPRIILRAYDDRDGITARFNLNLLARMNRELEANFELDKFEHYQNYDPGTGACKSYLVSLRDQTVNVAGHRISFLQDESMFMEVSQKYTLEEAEELAWSSRFKQTDTFLDTKAWFANVLWKAI
jgi:L-histidine N-alpha-methyltransferase